MTSSTFIKSSQQRLAYRPSGRPFIELAKAVKCNECGSFTGFIELDYLNQCGGAMCSNCSERYD